MGRIGKYWIKTSPKLSRANSNSCNSMCDVRGNRWLCLSSFVAVHTSPALSGWFHCPYACLGRCLMAVAPITSWDLYCNPGFAFTVLHNGLSGLLHRDSPDSHLASADVYGNDRRFQKAFIHMSFMVLKQKKM